MAYTQQDHRLDYFATTRWADTPARMLSPLLARALHTSGLFKAAVESPAPIDAQLRLESELLKLRHTFSDKASAVELSMKFTLYDLTQSRVLADRVVSVTEAAPSSDPYGGVIAANRAVDRMLTQLVNLLAQVLATEPLNCG
jgi:cholesterol transport system auxiliary component